jgi:hypothetical protein
VRHWRVLDGLELDHDGLARVEPVDGLQHGTSRREVGDAPDGVAAAGNLRDGHLDPLAGDMLQLELFLTRVAQACGAHERVEALGCFRIGREAGNRQHIAARDAAPEELAPGGVRIAD